MISTALLLLQLALHCTVEGKHYLVKTKDETKQDQTKDETSPAGQVSDFSRMSYQIYKSINIYECHTRSIKVSIFKGRMHFLSYTSDAHRIMQRHHALVHGIILLLSCLKVGKLTGWRQQQRLKVQQQRWKVQQQRWKVLWEGLRALLKAGETTAAKINSGGVQGVRIFFLNIFLKNNARRVDFILKNNARCVGFDFLKYFLQGVRT